MSSTIGRIWAFVALSGALLLSVGCGGDEASEAPVGAGGTGAGGMGAGGAATPCSNTGMCAAPTPYCDMGSGVCVECMGNANCSNFGNRAACNTTTHRCVECAADADCGGGGGRPYCDVPNGRCVACMADANCNDPAQGCDLNTHSCVDKCTMNGGCSFPRPYCDSARGLCVECQGDANCGARGGGVCDMTTFTCVECKADADCGMGNPYCSPTHRCVECLTDANCRGGRCMSDGSCN